MKFDATILSRLRTFRKLNKFKKAALSIIACMLTDDAVVQGRDLFSRLDENGDGYVSIQELRETMVRLGGTEADEASEEIFKLAEKPAKKGKKSDIKQLRKKASFMEDGNLAPFSYTEFLAATFDRSKYTTEAVCKAAFMLFDKDRSGQLDKTELLDGRLLGKLEPEEAEQLVNEIDADGDCEISFEEFMNLMAADD